MKCKEQPISPAVFNQVLRWALSGSTAHEIEEAIAKEYPDQQPRPLIASVLRYLESESRSSKGAVIGWCMEATRDMYRRMVEIGDFPGALRAVKQLADLARLDVCDDSEEEGRQEA